MADLDHGLDLHDTEIEDLAGFDESSASVLYVSVPASARSRSLDNEIAGLPPEALRNSMTVLRLHPWNRDAFDEEDLRDIWARVSRVPLYVLEYDQTGTKTTLRCVLGAPVAQLDGAKLTDLIRPHELRSVLLAPGALLPAYDRLHYEGPNGNHYSAFLRPGFALTSNDRLDRV